MMGKINSKDVDGLFRRQFNDWEVVKERFDALKGVKVRNITVGKASFKLQFNPARIVSSAAKVDAKSLKERKCFLCAENRPSEQEALTYGENYEVLINPFPIFPKHLTIPCINHTNQLIAGRIGDMLDIAADLDEYILFYNGPKCGASAPDHMHFQAGNKGFMTFDADLALAETTEIKSCGEAVLMLVEGLARRAFVIESTSKTDVETLFDNLYAALPKNEDDTEPMLNILCWNTAGKWTIVVFPRVKHRPACYFAEGDDNILITPASVDMGGVLIAPLEKDFEKVTADDIRKILDEVCYTKEMANRVIEKIQNK